MQGWAVALFLTCFLGAILAVVLYLASERGRKALQKKPEVRVVAQFIAATLGLFDSGRILIFKSPAFHNAPRGISVGFGIVVLIAGFILFYSGWEEYLKLHPSKRSRANPPQSDSSR